MSYSRAGHGSAVSLQKYRTRQCRFPTKIQDTAVPFPYKNTVLPDICTSLTTAICTNQPNLWLRKRARPDFCSFWRSPVL
ncbi:hypothetical protein QT989_07585 [Microcoleus sp. SVA1_B6]|uniref:hypothetical protein n=1 Tax=unclassified Microcoleus TaxID=2642155 RepID=UPI002FCFA32E